MVHIIRYIYIVLLNKINGALECVKEDNHEHEYNRDDSCDLGKDFVHRFALFLTEESFRAAGDSAGQVLAFAVLHKHG